MRDNLLELAVELLDDPHGISKISWINLKAMLSESAPGVSLLSAVTDCDGRYFLEESDALHIRIKLDELCDSHDFQFQMIVDKVNDDKRYVATAYDDGDLILYVSDDVDAKLVDNYKSVLVLSLENNIVVLRNPNEVVAPQWLHKVPMNKLDGK